MKNFVFYILLVRCFIEFGCNNTLQCERHFLPKGYIGDVMIYYDQINGQHETDKSGCAIYNISLGGKCLSGFPFKQGTAIPNVTVKYFEFIDKMRVEQLQEYEPTEYYADSIKNQHKKYVYFIASGYRPPNYYSEYFVDYGINHKKYDNR